MTENNIDLDKTIRENKLKEIEKNAETKTNIYYGIRFIQMLCIGAFVFGTLWEGTEQFNMTTPQFLMVYGGAGAVISEVVARVFKKKIIK